MAIQSAEYLQQLYDTPFASVLKDHKQFWEVMLNSMREHIDRLQKIMEIVHEIDPASILDVGTNFGLVGALLCWHREQQERLLHGVDVSSYACAYAKTVMGYHETFCGDARLMQFPQTYDLVLCLEVLEHLEDSESMVKKVSEITHKHALFSVPEEKGEIDGEFHVKHVSPAELHGWVQKYFKTAEMQFQPANFMEKPHWQGWWFCLASKE